MSGFSKLWIAAGLLLITPLLLFAIVGLGGFIPGGERGPENESLGNIGSITSQELPEPLKAVFVEAGRSTGVPPALLAATMFVECRQLFGPIRSGKLQFLEKLKFWLDNEVDVDARHCGQTNTSNVSGPMQFQAGKTYLRQKGLKFYDKPHLPDHGTWEGRIEKVRGARNREPSINNIKDSVYAAGFLHAANKAGLINKEEEFKGKDWDYEPLIKAVAIIYCHGNYSTPKARNDETTSGCKGGILNGERLGYGAGVLYHYKRFSQSL